MNQGGLFFLDLENGKEIKSVLGHEKGVFDICKGPENGTLLACGGDGKLSLWDLEQFKITAILQLSPASIRTIIRIKNQFAIGSSEGKIYLLDEKLRQIREWKAHNLSVFRLLHNPFNGQLISTGRDASIKSWDAKETFSETHSIPAHMYAINDLVVHPEQPVFFSGSMDKSIRFWDANKMQILGTADFLRHGGHRNGVNRLLWHENSLLSCGDDRLIMRWKFN